MINLTFLEQHLIKLHNRSASDFSDMSGFDSLSINIQRNIPRLDSLPVFDPGYHKQRTASSSGRTLSYPNVSEISQSSLVRSAMNLAWRKMIDTASEHGRIEYGFFIYKNYEMGNYYIGKLISGPEISGCAGTNAHIELGIPIIDRDCCACFHCHTTLKYCTELDSRET